MSRSCTSCNDDENLNKRISLKCSSYVRLPDTWDGKSVKVLTSRLKQSHVWVRSGCNRISWRHDVKSPLHDNTSQGRIDGHFKRAGYLRQVVIYVSETPKFPVLSSKCTTGTSIKNLTYSCAVTIQLVTIMCNVSIVDKHTIFSQDECLSDS